MTYDETTARLDELNTQYILEGQYPFNVTYADITAMDRAERNTLEDALTTILEADATAPEWDLAYEVYLILTEVRDNEYRDAYEADFRAWCKANIWGKYPEEIDADTWNYYSDWHKDMYGFRPTM